MKSGKTDVWSSLPSPHLTSARGLFPFLAIFVQGRQLTGETINTLTADYIQSTLNPTPQEVGERQEVEVGNTTLLPLTFSGHSGSRHQFCDHHDLHADIRNVADGLRHKPLRVLHTLCVKFEWLKQ